MRDDDIVFVPKSSAPPENKFYADDKKVIKNILEREWSFGIDYTPTFTYNHKALFTDAHIGNVHIKRTERYNTYASTDRSTIKRESFLTVRFASQTYDMYMAIGDEIYRILYQYSRAGPKHLLGYTYLEILNDVEDDGVDGWYSGSISIVLKAPAKHIRSPGFGPNPNKLT